MALRRWLPLSSGGFTYIEALAALALTAMLMVGLTRTLGNVLDAHDGARIDHDAMEESRYALERMVRAVSRSQRLLVPLAENPVTSHSESVRDPGVLAVTLDQTRDLDSDGFPDADNDGDGLFDEDLAADSTFDLANGIVGIDDDGDGLVDEGFGDNDDDEDGLDNEEIPDGLDNDGDGTIDEDIDDDMNQDGQPGIAGFDDDGDALVDEGNQDDDDEDGLREEDWWDAVVFYQSGAKIVERIPVPWDESGGGLVSGLDYVERTIATNVIKFYVERIPAPNGGPPLVSVQLTRNDGMGQPQTLKTTIKLGGGS